MFIGIFFFEYIEIWIKDIWAILVMAIIYGLAFKNVGSVSQIEPRILGNDAVWG